MVCPVAHPGLVPSLCLPLHTLHESHDSSSICASLQVHASPSHLPALFLPFLSTSTLTHTVSTPNTLVCSEIHNYAKIVTQNSEKNWQKYSVHLPQFCFYLSGSLLNKNVCYYHVKYSEVKIGYINSVCLRLSLHRSSFSHLLL